MPYVFSANAGRCGSGWLATLLATAAGVDAHHEPVPQLMPTAMAASETDASDALDRKTEAITTQLTHSGCTVYAETSNAFVKSRPAELLARLPGPSAVVVLRRELIAQIHSFVRVGFHSFDGAEIEWPRWMPVPPMPGTVTRTPGGIAHDQIDRVISYLVDVEARTMTLRGESPDTRFIDVTIEALQSADTAHRLLHDLGLEPTASTNEVVTQRVNVRASRGRQVDPEVLLGRVHHYLEACTAAGLGLEAGLLAFRLRLETPSLPHEAPTPSEAEASA